MTKEKARHILERYLASLVDVNTETLTLPIVDEVVYTETITEVGRINQWTFKGLLKRAYDLQGAIPPVDRIGLKVGKLTVVEELPPKISPSGAKSRMVRCKCKCGNFRDMNLRDLLSKKSASCKKCLNRSIIISVKQLENTE